ncbi:MAG: hypothetical protein LBD75_04265 [Candidatus Peribacteria bacterium]|jgi:hypothetical protein|nr:hypothetical protein [Candidatus Peribacteria bacterium]
MKEWGKGSAGEGLTEALQELVTNSLLKSVNSDKNIWEGVADSALVGGIMGMGTSTIGAAGQVNQDLKTNDWISRVNAAAEKELEEKLSPSRRVPTNKYQVSDEKT